MTANTNTKLSPAVHHSYPSSNDGPEYGTRKRVGKACDSCRIKKSKCDGRKPCSRCIMDDKICTFTERKKSREKLYSSRYVELLENRIEILQNAVTELVRRVSRGEDISCLISKNGHISINRALQELTNTSFDLQKAEHERFVIMHEHDDSEHDTEHEHEHDDADSIFAGSCDVKMEEPDSARAASSRINLSTFDPSQSQEWAVPASFMADPATVLPSSAPAAVGDPHVPVQLTFDPLFSVDPATIIRGHNTDSMSPASISSVPSLYSSSSSPSPVEGQYTFGSLNNVNIHRQGQSVTALTGYMDPVQSESPMVCKDNSSDIWFTSKLLEI
ncbi:uncharacterized protein V1518DRAFT_161694 [Limtongia smithiae]|uniref:uncharacterized protein n=1 Tax=Limtongia smithiae TaxID=1125753 RepID=UPI0034CE0F62